MTSTYCYCASLAPSVYADGTTPTPKCDFCTGLRTTPFEVFDLRTNESHGTYETLDEARGCVEFDGLAEYEIIRDGWVIVESSSFDVNAPYPDYDAHLAAQTRMHEEQLDAEEED